MKRTPTPEYSQTSSPAAFAVTVFKLTYQCELDHYSLQQVLYGASDRPLHTLHLSIYPSLLAVGIEVKKYFSYVSVLHEVCRALLCYEQYF